MTTRDRTPSYLLLKSEFQNGRKVHKKYEVINGREFTGIAPLLSYKDGASKKIVHEGYRQLPKLQEEEMLPLWLHKTSDIDNSLTKISDLVVKLKSYHANNLLPNMGDSSKLEKSIEITTQEITRLFHKTKDLINRFSLDSNISGDHLKLKKNIQASKLDKLHVLSLYFRQIQRSYLSALQKRTNSFQDIYKNNRAKVEDFDDDDEENETFSFGFTTEQIAMVDEMTENITKRDKEIRQLLVSIADLSSLFNDISILANQQSGVLDNIENNLNDVEGSTIATISNLEDTNRYHKEYRSRLCILMVLICLVTSMFAIYILKIIF
ncbi:hypothetical protein DICPUDRAFT_26866 [Dictyostelium purpureum]|uniref:t-SNARE coiled-coil homology domain-containing protein n=1 Tax=Dictyostelium purpureum TaxID=5786 RepID=F0Z9A6_DICPU|nr:uncharacterized protein DICPUDRAFT_26866 [Dictyostelium purpureum]EGC39438.1 hypothetical protein DICPUDRAFT_26866 [Dictyostelium purpureum]|eukprot:XP_003283996.1 hypothetical protein DICPUDRAFT_26866 [Dictyostelium purpureum]